MLKKGIFGGTYFNQLVDYRIFPQDWFSELDESFFLSQKYNSRVNFFKIKSGQSQEEWEKKDGFIKMIQEGGLNGIVNIIVVEGIVMI